MLNSQVALYRLPSWRWWPWKRVFWQFGILMEFSTLRQKSSLSHPHVRYYQMTWWTNDFWVQELDIWLLTTSKLPPTLSQKTRYLRLEVVCLCLGVITHQNNFSRDSNDCGAAAPVFFQLLWNAHSSGRPDKDHQLDKTYIWFNWIKMIN